MKTSARVLLLIAVGLALLSASGCSKLQARDHLNKGVQAYKSNKYEEAINHFQQSIQLDPSLLNARLYLATAYAQQYIPGAETEDNTRMGQQAIDTYKEVLQRDPKNINSVKGIASLYFNMKKFDQAKEYHHKVIELDPNDPDAYYSIGVIDWSETYQPRMEERAKLGLKPEEWLKDKKVCAALKDKGWNTVQDGIDSLNKALQLRPDYDDAMAYLNLMYREKADLECGDDAAHAADLKTADDWVDKTMATKKAKAEKQPGSTGITLDEQNK